METGRAEKLNWRLKGAVNRKVKEFKKAGYQNVTSDALWEYVTRYRWKKGKPAARKEQLMSIMSVTWNEYFDYERIKAQSKKEQIFSWDDLDDLL